jgi:protein-tyrosine phosphatase
MREILSGKLWLGNAGDVRNVERLIESGIIAVMSLAAEEPLLNLPRSMISCRFPLMDGSQNSGEFLKAAVETLDSLLQNQIPTLVYCSGGMSRSPAVIAAALSIVQGGSPEEKLQKIVSGHPHDVSPQLWEVVREMVFEIRQKKMNRIIG